MHRDLVRLSRAISHALRHEPWLYELELDDEGWVPVDDLLAALRSERAAWRHVTPAYLEQIIAQSDKRRFELRDGRMRALYGHSTPNKLLKVPASPPATLFHGTSRPALAAIGREGLRPMARQYVHLSADEPTARQVARRRQGEPVILLVRAGEAHRQGIRFYQGNEHVWLADQVPPRFIALPLDP